MRNGMSPCRTSRGPRRDRLRTEPAGDPADEHRGHHGPGSPARDTTTVTTTSPAAPDTKINTNAGPGTSNGTDTATADAVNTAIVHNKQMTGSRVEVVVTDGVARLNGTVQDQQQKALAGTTASNTPGVSSVLNKTASRRHRRRPCQARQSRKPSSRCSTTPRSSTTRKPVPVPAPSDNATAAARTIPAARTATAAPAAATTRPPRQHATDDQRQPVTLHQSTW